MTHFHGTSPKFRLRQLLDQVSEYTLICAIIILSLIALVGVSGSFGLARAEQAYQAARV